MIVQNGYINLDGGGDDDDRILLFVEHDDGQFFQSMQKKNIHSNKLGKTKDDLSSTIL